MKTKFIEQEMAYDGTQLRSLFAYLNYELLGDSAVAWMGPCHIDFEHMVDGEDLLQKAQICGDNMLHFIVEKFDVNLFSAVAIQRLLASIVIDGLKQLSPEKDKVNGLVRDGDDIFLQKQKLSISIATSSPTSQLIHFAVNITNVGTPVETLCLQELSVDPKQLAHWVLDRLAQEVHTITEATQKVKWVK